MLLANAVEISTPVGVVALAVSALAVAGIAWMWKRTRPAPIQPSDAGIDLADERPAVVALLTGGFDLDEAAMPATVIDLAHRGYFTIEKYGKRTVLRLRQRTTDDRPLAPYEQRVLEHIRRSAVDGVTPAEVLTLGEHGVSDRWFRSFRREVTADARAQGLCERRWGVRQLAIVWGLVALAFAAPLLAGQLAPRTVSPLGWGSVGNVLAGVAFVAAFGVAWFARDVTSGDAQIDTAAGREAAAHWLGVREFYLTQDNFEDKEAASVAIWDDHLAYATAMGLARQVERELPFAAESDKRAWSNVTGEWRRVTISYWSLLPFHGQRPVRVALSGLVQAAVFGVLAYVALQIASNDPSATFESLALNDSQLGRVSFVSMLVTIGLGALVLFCVGKVVIGINDLVRRRTVEGLVLRRRSYAEGLDKYAEQVERRLRLPFRINIGGSANQDGRHQRQRNRFVAIDDGTADRIRALRVESRIYDRVAQGATVRITMTPILGYVADVTILAAPANRPSTDRVVHHELITNTVTAAGNRLAGYVSKLTDNVDSDEGRRMLDTPDDEGVTPRSRLATAQGQLDRLRRDPRLRNSPFGGLLDSLGKLAGPGATGAASDTAQPAHPGDVDNDGGEPPR